MKNSCKKLASLGLALVLLLGLAAPVLAAGQTFSDVPESYWGYADIEAVAEAGLMNGTGGGAFSPEMKVSVAQFLTLLGRLVFPEVKTEGADWFGPYVAAAQKAGLLAGSQVDANQPEAEISRYDMAVILRAAAKKLGVAEKSAQSSEVTDYLDIPTRYAEAVLAVYGMGLIKGDQAGNFNGSNTMMRAEVATVIMRLAKAKPGGSSQGGTTDPQPTPGPEQPEKPEPVDPLEPEIIPMPDGEKMVSRSVRLRVLKADHVIGRPVDTKRTPLADVPVKLYYTPDGGKTAVLVDEFKSPSQVEYESNGWSITKTFDAPESWSSAENYENGNGFYFSAETALNGQRLVTSDLRTDGRAYPDIQCISPVDDPSWPVHYDIELTPPDGEKAKFTFQGYVEGFRSRDDRLSDFTIRLYLADGTLVAETVSHANGTFSMECEVDALDGGFDRSSKLYYYTASGYIDGARYEYTAIDPNDGTLMLKSLVRLHAVDEIKAGPPSNPNFRIVITPFYRVDS